MKKILTVLCLLACAQGAAARIQKETTGSALYDAAEKTTICSEKYLTPKPQYVSHFYCKPRALNDYLRKTAPLLQQDAALKTQVLQAIADAAKASPGKREMTPENLESLLKEKEIILHIAFDAKTRRPIRSVGYGLRYTYRNKYLKEGKFRQPSADLGLPQIQICPQEDMTYCNDALFADLEARIIDSLLNNEERLLPETAETPAAAAKVLLGYAVLALITEAGNVRPLDLKTGKPLPGYAF